ncbi:MAG: type IV toxin-antitoxin system AbiEi family antitoxin domain-containing protein [Chloroflexota bacterium]|nr:type IV toxin-antitoxin system AbiEi family antitoxin domain-containing protein [Chloroflexota bacterium]
MKNTILAVKDGELLETLIAKYGKVATAKQIEAEAKDTWDYQQMHNRIQQLVKNGWLVRIKRGLYAINDLSSRGFLSISPYVVASLLVEDSYVSFEAALNYRGMFDQFVQLYSSVSLKQYKLTELEPIQYQFIKTQEKFFVGWDKVEIENMTAKIASAEKALVDLIHFRTSKYVIDLIIEKLQNYKEDLRVENLIHYASLASQKTVKVFGLTFDLLGWDSQALFQLLSNTRSTHWINAGDKTFNAKWRLYYDTYFDKYQIDKGE